MEWEKCSKRTSYLTVILNIAMSLYNLHDLLFCIGSDDLFDIYSELLPVASKWKNIGLALRLTPNSLNTIGAKENVTDCLLEVLTQWLKKTYNVERFGEPSWKLLVKAVSDPAGGNDRALAENIAKKHQGNLVYIMDGIHNNYTFFPPVPLDQV